MKLCRALVLRARWQHAPAGPWWTTRTTIHHIQTPRGRRTDGRPAPCDRRSHRSHRIHRVAYSGPPLTPRRTSSASPWRASCRQRRQSHRKACIWSRGCDLTGHLWGRRHISSPRCTQVHTKKLFSHYSLTIRDGGLSWTFSAKVTTVLVI